MLKTPCCLINLYNLISSRTFFIYIIQKKKKKITFNTCKVQDYDSKNREK